MSVHISIPHVHLPHPSPEVRHVLETGVVVASTVGWSLAAVTAVGFGYGPHLALAAALAAAYLAGAYRTKRAWSARHQHVLHQLQLASSAQQRDAARRRAEMACYAAADREPHAARKDRHTNTSYASRANERSGR